VGGCCTGPAKDVSVGLWDQEFFLEGAYWPKTRGSEIETPNTDLKRFWCM